MQGNCAEQTDRLATRKGMDIVQSKAVDTALGMIGGESQLTSGERVLWSAIGAEQKPGINQLRKGHTQSETEDPLNKVCMTIMCESSRNQNTR